MPLKRSAIRRLIDGAEPTVQEAFLGAIEAMASDVDLRALTSAIDANDIKAAMEAINVNPGAWDEMHEQLRSVFRSSAKMQEGAISRGLRFRVDMRSPRAERIAGELGSTLIREINEGQRDTIRGLIRDGIRDGRAPRSVALDITGRYSRAAGRRVGGVLGLTARMTDTSFEVENDLAGTPPNPRYFRRKLRDRRYDRAIRKAIKEKRGLPDDYIERVTSRYRDGLLRARGRAVARTETLRAASAGQKETVDQLAQETGRIVTGTWSSAGGPRTRPDHIEMDGQVREKGEMFEAPTGARLEYPGDPNGGADQVVNCRCIVLWTSKAPPEEAKKGTAAPTKTAAPVKTAAVKTAAVKTAPTKTAAPAKTAPATTAAPAKTAAPATTAAPAKTTAPAKTAPAKTAAPTTTAAPKQEQAKQAPPEPEVPKAEPPKAEPLTPAPIVQNLKLDEAAAHTMELLELPMGMPARRITDFIDKEIKPLIGENPMGKIRDAYASDKSSVWMAIRPATIKKIISGDGRFKNSLETGTGSFKTKGDARLPLEKRVFGLADDVTPEDAPKYGFVAGSDRMNTPRMTAFGYGDVFVKFKQSVKRQATVTLTDSYDGNYYRLSSTPATPMLAPKDHMLLSYVDKEMIRPPDGGMTHPPGNLSVNAWRKKRLEEFQETGDTRTLTNGVYTEAQIHGRLSLDDVLEIEVEDSKDLKTITAALKKAERTDIKVVPGRHHARLKRLWEGSLDEQDSLRVADLDNLGDKYIDKLFKANSATSWDRAELPASLQSRMKWEVGGKAGHEQKVLEIDKIAVEDKRDFLKEYYRLAAMKKDSGLPNDYWWKAYKPGKGGYTDTVLDKSLLEEYPEDLL